MKQIPLHTTGSMSDCSKSLSIEVRVQDLNEKKVASKIREKPKLLT